MRSDDAAGVRQSVLGVALDAHSRCAHYHGPTDIVAIKFKCCGAYYACKDCHDALAGHPISVWPEAQWNELAIRCGACETILTIRAYLDGPPACPSCGAAFNPRCRYHHHLYFDVPALESPRI
jgi:uncharacterized CHY-type Zn-finger protein